MKKEAEIFTSTKHKSVLANPDWLDLPEPTVTNVVLEHLEPVDYIRFSSVCKRWYSIQKEHRSLYSHYPPPLLRSFPWLSCNHCTFGNDEVLFYLPDKQKSYTIPFPFCSTSKSVDRTAKGHECIFLLLFSNALNPPTVHIFNPISGAQIKLPPCSLSRSTFRDVHISYPLSDPNCTLLTVNRDHEVYLYGLNNNRGWKKVADCFQTNMKSSAFCNNKIYRLSYVKKIHMIDTRFPDPVEQLIEMDYSEISEAVLDFILFADLVDFFGELVMIITVHGYTELGYGIKEFLVYRADFLINKWVMMETLGDCVLFYSWSNKFALRAVDAGCKENAVYSTEGFMGRRVAWRAFDLSTRDWIDGPPVSLSNDKYHSNGTSCTQPRSKESYPVRWSWLRPNLDLFCGANTNGACQNICLDT